MSTRIGCGAAGLFIDGTHTSALRRSKFPPLSALGRRVGWGAEGSTCSFEKRGSCGLLSGFAEAPATSTLQKRSGLPKSRRRLQLPAASRADEAAVRPASSWSWQGRLLHPAPFHCAALTVWTFYLVLIHLPLPWAPFTLTKHWQGDIFLLLLSFCFNIGGWTVHPFCH